MKKIIIINKNVQDTAFLFYLFPKKKKTIINTTYELGSCVAGLFSPEAISVFKLKGQVNAKEGGKIYTTQSAFLRVLLKRHNISTYDKESSWAGFLGLRIDFGLPLTGK